MKPGKIFQDYGLYDGRYRVDPDRSIPYEFNASLNEARKNIKDYPEDTVIVRHLNKVQKDGSFLIIKSEIVLHN